MALHVLADNLTRVLNSLGIQPLMAALRASERGFARIPVYRRRTHGLQAMGASLPSTISPFALTDDHEGLWNRVSHNPTSAKAF
jgi:hypothetical protein